MNHKATLLETGSDNRTTRTPWPRQTITTTERHPQTPEKPANHRPTKVIWPAV
ncbi:MULTISPECIES: hypothetical protein [unclassified Kribbella]|uniref:hypothetical protein n=1 Tax=unclassified Kribbella TaxID=2644121 RepID=UPI0034105380